MVDIIFLFELFYNVLVKVFVEFLLFCIEIEEIVFSGVNLFLSNGKVDLGIFFFVFFNGFSEDLCEIEFVVVVYVDYLLY